MDKFELTSAEIDAVSGLAREDGRWFDGDPNRYEEF
jgi:2,5-diketo-D-gluconate reductase A